MATQLLISRNGGTGVPIDLPYGNKPPVTYKYSMESDDLSAFTSAYTTSIELPKTHANCHAFNFPDNVGYGAVNQVDYFTYTYSVDLEPSGTFTDSGKCIISAVTDTININLLSTLADFNTALENATWPTGTTAYKKAAGSASQISPSTDFQPCTLDFTVNEGVKYSSSGFWDASFYCKSLDNKYSDGLFILGIVDVGVPNDATSELTTLSTAGNQHVQLGGTQNSYGDFVMLQAPGIQVSSSTVRAGQIRWYVPRLCIPLHTIVYNAQIDGFTLELSNSVKAILSGKYYVGPRIGDLSDSDDNSTTFNASIKDYYLSDKTPNTRFGMFHAKDVFAKLEKPGDIIKRLFKQLNIRLKWVSGTTYRACTVEEYYSSSSPIDISTSIDRSTYQVSPHAFKYSDVVFEGSGLDTAVLKSYKDKTSYEFNRGKYPTGYNVTSEKKWFSNSVKYVTSYPHKYSAPSWYKKDTPVEQWFDCIGAYDADGKEVDISGCIASDNGIYLSSFIIGDVSTSLDTFEPYSGYFNGGSDAQSGLVRDYMSVAGASPKSIILFRSPNYVYDEPKYVIEGQTTHNVFSLYFKDVYDSLKSSLVTTNVVFSNAYTDISSVINKMYWFDNNYWVVWEIGSFIPGSKEPCEVTFLKVNDVSNYGSYFPTELSNSVSGDGHASYDVTVNGSSVATPSSFTTNPGDYVNVDITCNSGYAIDYIECTSGDIRFEQPTSFYSMYYYSTEDFTIYVHTKNIYTLTASAGSGGTVSPTSGYLNPGSSVTLTAVPNDGYAVSSWTDNGVTTYTTSTTFTISNIQASHTVSVAFRSTAAQLTVSAYDMISHTTGQGGTVAYVDATHTTPTYQTSHTISGYDGDAEEILQRAGSGYEFDHWEYTNGTYISSANSLQWTLQGATNSIRACFKPTGTVTYPLILTSGTGIGNTYGTGSYAQGTQVSISCDVDTGYTFDDWYDEGTALHLQQSDTYEMPGSTKTLQARATSSGKYVLKFSGVNCSVSQSEVEVTPGQSVTITVTPSTGYSWGSWNDGNTDNPRTFTPIASASYTATCWEPRSYTYRFSASTGGQVSQSELIGLPGTSATITASVTDSDYEFDRWDDDTTTPRTYGASRLFTIGNHSQDFVALFKRVRSSVTITSDDIEHCEFSLSEEGPWYTTLILNGTIGTSSNSVYSSLTNHYYISDWDDGEPVVEPRTFEFLNVDSVVTAHIQEDLKWTLFFTVDGPGEVSQSSYRGYTGSTVTVTATSRDGDYDFDCWTDMPTVHNNPTRQFTVGSSDRTYTARFKRVRSSITVTSDDTTHARFYTSGGTHRTSLTFNGTIGTSTADVYSDLDYHYYISSWDDGEPVEEPRTFTFQDVDTVVTANIAEDLKWTLSFEVMGSGAIGGQVSPTSYHGYTDDTVSVTASSKTGSLFPTGKYVFDHWSDLPSTDPSYASATRTFTVGSSNKTYYAVFRQAKVTLTFNATNGTCSPSSALVNINSTSPSVTCTPSSGYRFKQWDDGSTASTRTFQAMLTDRTYTATCVYDESDVSLVVSPPLAGTTTGAGTYAKNDSVTLTATANDGYEFKYWWDLISAKYASASNPYQFTMGSSDRAFEARFESAEPILRPIYIQGSGTVSVTVNGVEVDPTVSHTLESGDVVNVLAVPSGSATNVVWSFTGHTPYSGWLNDTALSWNASTYASAGYCVPPIFPANGGDNFTYRWGYVTSMDGFMLEYNSNKEGILNHQPSTAIQYETFNANATCRYMRPTFKTANRDTSYIIDNTTGRYVVGGIMTKGYTFEITGPVTITATFNDYTDYPLVMSRNTNE